MNAIELAENLEGQAKYWEKIVPRSAAQCRKAAALLRAQHEALGGMAKEIDKAHELIKPLMAECQVPLEVYTAKSEDWRDLRGKVFDATEFACVMLSQALRRARAVYEGKL